MRINLVGAFIRNFPFGTEIAFKRGFERLGGHQVTCVDTSYENQILDRDADATIIFKTIDRPEYWGLLEECSGVKVVYQPDDLRFPHIQTMMREIRRLCQHALTFDVEGAILARQLGFAQTRSLLVTADDGIYHPMPAIAAQKDIDFLFAGSFTGGQNHASRRRMVDILTNAGMNVAVCTDVYDPYALATLYNRAKVVLNHATDVGQPFGSGYGYQCRHFEVGFTRSCLLSNRVIGERRIRNFVEYRDERELVEVAQWLICDEGSRKMFADRLYDELNSSHRPERRAAEMVEFLEEVSCD